MPEPDKAIPMSKEHKEALKELLKRCANVKPMNTPVMQSFQEHLKETFNREE